MRRLFISACLFFTFAMVMTVSSVAEPKPEGKLTILYGSLGNESLDTVKRMAREEEAIIFSLGDSLTVSTYEQSGDRIYIPGIATSWKASEDLKTWEAVIRKDVKFHDGTLLTLDDVIYTYNRVLHSPESRQAGAKRSIESVEAKGDDRIVFHLKAPNPFHQYEMTAHAIHPKAYTEKIGEKAFADKPIYAGPFKFVKRVQGDYVEMEAFEEHYRKVPYFKSLILRKVPEPSTQLAMLKTGEADVLCYIPLGPAIDQIKKDPNLRVVSFPMSGETYGIYTSLVRNDLPNSPFWDKRVRHALSCAIDRQLIIDKIYYGYGVPATVPCFIPGSPQWHADAPKSIPYDIEKAKTFLKEAGYPNGLDVELNLTSREKTEGEAIAGMWAKAGIRAKIKMWETGAILKRVRKRTLPEGVRLSRHQSTPAGLWYYFRKDQTYTTMMDEKLDRLTRKMATFPEGPQMNEFIKNEMCLYVADLMPHLSIATRTVLHGVRPHIDTEEWLKRGTRHINYVPAAEYLKQKK